MNSYELQKMAKAARRIEERYGKANNTAKVVDNSAEAASRLAAQGEDALAARDNQLNRDFGGRVLALKKFLGSEGAAKVMKFESGK